MKNSFLPKLFVLTACLWCALGADAYDFSSGGFYFDILNSNEVEVTYQELGETDTYTGVITIPSTVTHNGTTYTVTRIGYQAFSLSPITEVTIPNTVTRIGGNAFRICNQLEKVTMSDAVTVIYSQAFEGCRRLKEINISENLEVLPFSCFSWCDSLKSIYLPHSIKTVQSNAFKEAHNLKAITCMAWEPPTIDETAFESDVLSSATLTVPKSSYNDYKDASSGWSAFNTIKSLYYDIEKDGVYFLRNSWGTLDVTYKDNNYNSYSGHVRIPGWITLHEGDIDVEGIGTQAFMACRNLTSVSLTSSIKIIRDRAFMYCSGLSSITIPGSVETIDKYAFTGCSSLAGITLREGLKTIGMQAMSAIGLTSITLPASLESIDGSSLSCNTSLPAINVSADNPTYVSIDGVLYTRDGKTLVTYPAGKSGTAYTVLDGVQVIANNAFDRARSLTEVNLPNSLRQVQTSAFRECNALRQMVYPRGVTSIANSAMDNCNSMTHVTLPSTLTYLGSNAFARCTSLSTIYVKAVIPPVCDIYEWYDYDWDEYVTDYAFTSAQFINGHLYVPIESYNDYRNADTWCKFVSIAGVNYPPEFIQGDVNDDGLVNTGDLSALIGLLLGGGDLPDSADCNQDGNKNVGDVPALINFLLTGSW